MGIHQLSNLFSPSRIAILSSGTVDRAFERHLLLNITAGGFQGPIYPIDSRREAVCGIPAHKSIKAIRKRPDLAVILGLPETIPKKLKSCGKAGVPAAVIFSMDFRHRTSQSNRLMEQLFEISREYGIRFIGPNSLGFIRPRHGLNISVSIKSPPPGNIAFISQSSTLASAILSYAAAKHVGLSTFISVGGQTDIDFADLIDFLSLDPETRGIVIYLESIQNGRAFLSATRSFTRTKPIVVVKGGRFEQSRLISFSRMGALAGEDSVYHAVFKRAGMVRVDDAWELFTTSEALSKQRAPKGNKLAIVTNAGGPAVLAIDTLLNRGGTLASFSPQTVDSLTEVLPPTVPITNPLDCLSDASAARYSRVIDPILREEDADGLLVIITPQPLSEPLDTASYLIQLSKRYPYKTILACWMGSSEQMIQARKMLNQNAIPTYVAPEQAVKSFLYMYEYEANRQLLTQTPSNILVDFYPDQSRAAEVLTKVARQGRLFLMERETKEVLEAYGLKTTPMRLAKTAEEALKIGREVGFPVAMKVESPDISHKSKVKGVMLNVSQSQVEEAFERIRANLKRYRPNARFNGVTIEPMLLGMGYEFAIASKKDPTFGAVIIFGLGGQLLEAERDYAVGLPPLNQTLAQVLIEETRVCKALREEPENSQGIKRLEEALVRFSILVADFPLIRAVEVNSLFMRGEQVVCLDGRIVLEPEAKDGVDVLPAKSCPEHLVICPYPCQYITSGRFRDGSPFLIRPIKPEDEPLMRELFNTFSQQTIINRFFQLKKEISHEELARYCQVDYNREIALVAVTTQDNRERIIGVVRLTLMPDERNGELAIVVGDPWQGKGVGSQLMDKILGIARERGICQVWMDVLLDNKPMRSLASKFGFKEVASEDPEIVKYVLELTSG